MVAENALVDEIIKLKRRLHELDNDRLASSSNKAPLPPEETGRRLANCLNVETFDSSFPFVAQQPKLDAGTLGVENFAGFSRHYSNDDMLDSQSMLGS